MVALVTFLVSATRSYLTKEIKKDLLCLAVGGPSWSMKGTIHGGMVA